MAKTEIRASQLEAVSLTAEVSGVLPVANGGTGAATLTGIIEGNGTGAFTVATPGIDYTTPSSTETQTNKRNTPRVTTSNTPGATPTVATDSWDQINFTGLNAAITSMTSGKTGTPDDGQPLMMRFKDNGTGRAIAWGADYVSSGVATLLATTVANKTHLVGLRYDSAAVKWVCIAVDATGY